MLHLQLIDGVDHSESLHSEPQKLQCCFQETVSLSDKCRMLTKQLEEAKIELTNANDKHQMEMKKMTIKIENKYTG